MRECLCLTYFCCTVNVLDGEHRTQTIQENLSQRWYELRRGHQHVYTVTPVGHRQRTDLIVSKAGETMDERGLVHTL